MDNFCPCFFVSLFTCDVSATSSTQLMSNQTQDDLLNICDFVYCGKGTCQLSSAELLGFTCDCESGWKKPNIGSIELPPCSFPNCTVNFNCGNGSPAPPSSPPTQVSDPCLLNFCGDGNCVSHHGFDFRCQCNEGSENLLNDPKLFCFKKCTFGGDCNGFDLGFSSETPPPPATSGTASPGTTASSGETLSCTGELHMLAMTILALIFQIYLDLKGT
ncbi:hypothetical protein GLYMA_07G033900v4 [Glycine max]|uniref:slit homolog 2 protein-like n=1 Tax=Glycine soja TaxID=3848 RepID=UPI00103EBCCB|nr:slit homolog 2 protein-like [Glycine soja]XP_040873165.1 slit homolog 2 protein-like isoform X1 [Glycine max]KAG4400328.1 hypothetical protein GLYMA_07G033900v4 [Glycine max]